MTVETWSHGGLTIQRIQMLDEWILRRLVRFESPSVTRAMRTLTHLGDTSSWTAYGVMLLVIGGQTAIYGQRLALAALSAALVAQALKRIFRRRRPSAELGGRSPLCEVPCCYSFPSGHTMTAFAVATSFGLMSSIGALTLVLAVGIGISRIYLGAHYPFDVIVGAVVGGTMGFGVDQAFSNGWI